MPAIRHRSSATAASRGGCSTCHRRRPVTRGEAQALDILVGEFRQFREEDARWKASVDKWRREVDAARAVAQAEAADSAGDQEQARADKRTYVAAAAAVVAAAVSLVKSFLQG